VLHIIAILLVFLPVAATFAFPAKRGSQVPT
jgi:hypothetical protein